VITVDIDDVKEAQSWLNGISQSISDDEAWDIGLGRLGSDGVSFAKSISPVVTGSYRAAHQGIVQGKTLTFQINPSARNSVTGEAVSSYAGVIEARYGVYEQLEERVSRMAVDVFDSLLGEFE